MGLPGSGVRDGALLLLRRSVHALCGLWRCSRTCLAGVVRPAEAAPLENTGNNSSPDDRRRLRWARRAVLWKLSSLQAVRHCGRVPRSKQDGVTLRSRGGLGGFAGLQHCGSVWSCSVCGGRIRVHRALEIGAVLAQAVKRGHRLGFVTLTMRHHRGQPLEALWEAAARAWGRSTSGKQWVADRDAHLAGWVRVVEVGDGVNGWHVHIHAVVVMAAGAGAAELDEVASGMFSRWRRGLEAVGIEAVRAAQEWHIAEGERASEDLGEYLSKMADDDVAAGLGLELTHSAPGRAERANKTRPVWGVLDEFTETGDVAMLQRWHEWERGSKGKRQVAWSKGLRERFAPELEELSDGDIASQEVGSVDDDLVRWSSEQWRELVKRPERLVRLLELAEAGGQRAVAAQLDAWGVPYELVGAPR